MKRVRGLFRWITKPQLLVSFVVLCLLVGATGAALPPKSYTVLDASSRPVLPEVKGAATLAPPDCSVVACLALTFDDGPSDVVTPRILDILGRHRARATFFVVGQEVPGREHIVRRIHTEGHEIGNHSWNHKDFTTISPMEIREQIASTQAVVSGAGVPVPRLFRPPYGAVNPMVLSHVDMTVVKWNVDPEDWRAHDAAELQHTIMQQAKRGGIVVMHDLDPVTADALEPVIIALEQQYRFVTVSQLMEFTSGDRGQYFGR